MTLNEIIVYKNNEENVNAKFQSSQVNSRVYKSTGKGSKLNRTHDDDGLDKDLA